MVKGPCSHGKTLEEVAREVRVELMRIDRRRKRFRSAEENGLREARKRVAEAVAAGVSAEEAALAAGYALKTVLRWLAKKKGGVRAVSIERAWDQLRRVDERRRHAAVTERKISARARGLVRRAMEVGIVATEFAETTGYTLKTVTKWFASVRHSLEQAQRQREITSVRRGKANRPPQHLSPVEYDRWLVQAERERRRVHRRHGVGTRRNLGAEGGWLEVPAASPQRKKSLRGKAARRRKRARR